MERLIDGCHCVWNTGKNANVIQRVLPFMTFDWMSSSTNENAASPATGYDRNAEEMAMTTYEKNKGSWLRRKK